MKKIMILMSCVAIILSAMIFTKDNSIFAANVNDTFVERDFTYKIKNMGDATSNGKVEISDYDETSAVTTLTIPNTVEKDGKTFDVVSADRSAFENAVNVKTLNIPENFIDISTLSFVKANEDNFTIESALETIVVDENNSVLEVIDGVLYNVKNGEEDLLLYPYNSSKKEFIVPDLLINGRLNSLFDVIYYALHLESIVMPFESSDGYFTENGILYNWVDENDHSQGCNVLMIPQAMKKTIIGKNVVDASWALSDGGICRIQ